MPVWSVRARNQFTSCRPRASSEIILERIVYWAILNILIELVNAYSRSTADVLLIRATRKIEQTADKQPSSACILCINDPSSQTITSLLY
jgi:hypothetical protein